MGTRTNDLPVVTSSLLEIVGNEDIGGGNKRTARQSVSSLLALGTAPPDTTTGRGTSMLRHDLDTNTYFWEKKPSFSAAKMATKKGIRNSRVMCIGDDITEGLDSGLGGTGTYPRQLASILSGIDTVNALNTSFFGCGLGIGTTNWLTNYENRVTLSGSWAPSSVKLFGGQIFETSASGAVITFAPTTDFDTVDIYVAGSAGSAAIWNVAYDFSGTVMTIPSVNNVPIGRVTLTIPGAAALHVVKVTNNSNDLNRIWGMHAYKAGVKEVAIFNGGYGQASTTGWISVSPPYQPILSIGYLRPDAAVIALTSWDAYFGTPALTAAGQLQGIVDQCRIWDAEPLLLTGPPIDPTLVLNGVTVSQAVQDTYQNAYKRVATRSGAKIIDTYLEWGGTYAAAAALGYMNTTDRYVPSVSGYTDIANRVAWALRTL